MAHNRMSTVGMKAQQPGAPIGGKYHTQAIAPGSEFGDDLFDLLNNPRRSFNWSVERTIVTILHGFESRKASKTQILEGVRTLPCIARILASGTDAERANTARSRKAVSVYLDEELLKYDVKFPPEDYCDLYPQPGISKKKVDPTAELKWLSTVGLEMRNEE